MPRISKDFDERRSEFLEATKSLCYAHGYKKMSVQMLTEKVNVAKGTFYHYFKSKEDLLYQWVIHEIEQMLPAQIKIAEDSNMNGIEKLNKSFQYGRDWKLDHMEFIVSAMQIMYGANNLELRDMMIRQSAKMTEGYLSQIIQQGVEEGHFSTRFPVQIARKISQILMPFSDELSLIMINHYNGEKVTIHEAFNLIDIMHDTLERILGARPGSILLADKIFIQSLFDHISELGQSVRKTKLPEGSSVLN